MATSGKVGTASKSLNAVGSHQTQLPASHLFWQPLLFFPQPALAYVSARHKSHLGPYVAQGPHGQQPPCRQKIFALQARVGGLLSAIRRHPQLECTPLWVHSLPLGLTMNHKQIGSTPCQMSGLAPASQAAPHTCTPWAAISQFGSGVCLS